MTGAPAGAAYEGLAPLYDRRRPSYPAEAVRAVASLATAAAPSGSVLDVGCGTGIFTRLLAAELPDAFSVTGVEPSADMRATATSRSEASPRICFVAGQAEVLPALMQSTVLVTAATAAHWFDRPPFYAEAARVLAPGGSIALVQNERRWWDSSGLAEYETILESLVPDYRRGSHPDANGGFSVSDFAAELSANASFATPVTRLWNWEMRFDRDAFVEFSLSSSIVQRAIARTSRDTVWRALDGLLDRHSKNGSIAVQYRTKVVAAARAHGPGP
ncbi:MAG TPA: class I SAM-dependent methyltransferase, partial [Reyranella sp.]|nr:class I SAM-dependent methyltransferase [Reyranella sp.]